MAGANLTPRQKMINLMYLVLTALLALNVSAEILKAFAQIDDSLKATNSSIDAKNDNLMEAFKKMAQDEPEKAEANYKKALQAKAYCKTLLDTIDDIRNYMIAKTGNTNDKVDAGDYQEDEDGNPTTRLVDESNIDISSTVLVEPEGKNPRGLAFQKKIEDTRNQLIALIPKTQQNSVRIYLEKPEGQKAGVGVAAKSWLQGTFGDMPLGGVIALLTKLESDIKNTETEIINALIGDIDVNSIKVTNVEAKVIPKSNYVLQGQTFEADILLAAYDARKDYDMTVNGAKIPVEEGIGKYKAAASSAGVKKYNVDITLKVGGKDSTYNVEGEYLVAPPSAVVSPTKMNVFYIGVDNPVSISAAGVPTSSLRSSISGGGQSTLNPGTGAGNYMVRVTTPASEANPAKISVSATIDGKNLSMGTSNFRVKYIPDPLPTIGGLKGSSVPASTMRPQQGVIALLENFDFKAKFNVVSFRLLYLKPRQDPKVFNTKGPRFSGEMLKKCIKVCGPGDRIIADDIIVVGPDKRRRKLNPVTYGIR